VARRPFPSCYTARAFACFHAFGSEQAMIRLALSAFLILSAARVARAADAPAQADPADKAVPLSTLARLPVKEITVFKDGHSFVLHQGTMPTDADGHVILDNLPTPILGTFWPYAADKTAKLHSVVAGRRTVRADRTALTMHELIEANTGAEVLLTERGATY